MEIINDKNKNNHLFKRGNNNGAIGFAILLILAGTIFLLLNLGIIPEKYSPLFTKWPTVLIVIGLWLLIKRDFTTGIILTALGIFFIYPTLHRVFPEFFIDINIDMRTYWPVILIAVGVVLVFGRILPHNRSSRKWDDKYDGEQYNWSDNDKQTQSSADYIEKNIIFGGSEQIVLSQNFRGGDGNVMFGELVIDLRRAKLAQGIYKLELNVMFGGITVYVPTDWNVEVRTSSFLGAFDDKRYQSEAVADSPSKLVIKGNALLGGGEIKN